MGDWVSGGWLLFAPGQGFVLRCINAAVASSARCLLSSCLLRWRVPVASGCWSQPFPAAASFRLGLIALAFVDGLGLRRALYCA